MKKVLIVEDNKDVSTILKKKLEIHGFSVDLAEGGYAVLGYVRDSSMPHAIILDIILPERSGTDLLYTLKNKWPDTKIFIYSAYPEYEEKLEEYATGFFLKTDGMDNLIEAIKKEVGE